MKYSKTAQDIQSTSLTQTRLPQFSEIPTNISAELLAYGQSMPDVISLAQGDSNFSTPDYICKAACEAMAAGQTHYGPALGLPALRNQLSAYYDEIFDADVPAERVCVTSSGTTAMHLALESILSPGDEIVCITPIWRNLMGIIGLTGAKAVEVPLDVNVKEGWSLDLDKVRAACTSKTKAILIVTPSNPTGWVMPEDQMNEILSFGRQEGIWIVADEVYNRLAYDKNKTTSFLEIAQEDDFVFSVNSFSKAWAMTGWRLGWLVAPRSAVPVIQNLALYKIMGPNTFNQYGAIEALRQGETFIGEQMKVWEANLDMLENHFKDSSNIVFHRPEAAFYAFIKIKGCDDCVSLCRRLIDEARISVSPGCSFGEDFNGWVRISFATSNEIMAEAIKRIESINLMF